MPFGVASSYRHRSTIGIPARGTYTWSFPCSCFHTNIYISLWIYMHVCTCICIYIPLCCFIQMHPLYRARDLSCRLTNVMQILRNSRNLLSVCISECLCVRMCICICMCASWLWLMHSMLAGHVARRVSGSAGASVGQVSQQRPSDGATLHLIAAKWFK